MKSGRLEFHSQVFIVASTLFCMCLVMANVLSTKIVTIFGADIDGGFIFFPVTYIINDVITEVYGTRAARGIILSSLVMCVIATCGIVLVAWLPPSAEWHNQASFDAVFAVSVRLTTASLIAFAIGELLNSQVLQQLKNATKGRYMRLRFLASTLIGAGVENMLFYIIAFYGILSLEVIQSMALLQLLLKLLYELVAIQFTYRIANYLIKKEAL